jgi:hypothetical protein
MSGAMLDLIFVAIVILFFLSGWAFVKGCERL